MDPPDVWTGVRGDPLGGVESIGFGLDTRRA